MHANLTIYKYNTTDNFAKDDGKKQTILLDRMKMVWYHWSIHCTKVYKCLNSTKYTKIE